MVAIYQNTTAPCDPTDKDKEKELRKAFVGINELKKQLKTQLPEQTKEALEVHREREV